MLRKPWQRFDPANLKAIPATLGVYEVADAQGRTLYIGYAGGRSLFGLRGEIAQHFGPDNPNPVTRAEAALYRYEVTSAYLSRWYELLTLYYEAHHHLPPGNRATGDLPPKLGRFHLSPVTGRWQP